MSSGAVKIVATPWEQPWWRVHPSQRWIFAYLVAVHVLGVVGLLLFPLPSLGVLATALALGFLGGFGTTIGYHRALAHKALALHPWVERALVVCAMFNASGSPCTWAANHRLHHAKSDTDEDVSSPRHGFWWSHLRWLYQQPDSDAGRWCPDLRARYGSWERWQTPMVTASLAIGALWSLEAFFWVGAIRLLYSLHGQCTVNSVAHLGRGADGRWGEPVNLTWLGPLQLGAWGENWHANHHADARSARLGWTARQVDVGWGVIRVLERLGLATQVRRPRGVALPSPAARLVDAPSAAAPASNEGSTP